MNKLVKENVEDVLKGKSQGDIEDSIKVRLEEFKNMDEDDIIHEIADQFEMNPQDVAKAIILNTDIQARNQAIEDVFRGYIEYGNTDDEDFNTRYGR